MKSASAIRREIKRLNGVIAIREHTLKPVEKLETAEWALRWVLFTNATYRPSKGLCDFSEYELMRKLTK